MNKKAKLKVKVKVKVKLMHENAMAKQNGTTKKAETVKTQCKKEKMKIDAIQNEKK